MSQRDRRDKYGLRVGTWAALETDELDVVADRGYYNGEEILACEAAGITVTLPKPLTSNSRAKGRFVKQDFAYLAADDVYRCPAGERLVYRFTNQENGLTLRRYWPNARNLNRRAEPSTIRPETRFKVGRGTMIGYHPTQFEESSGECRTTKRQ